ncbi:DUF2777 domain-containing protein [Mesobacillus maritimus]|uniref:DUF2777 domain-containing protein n=1 Tax=Mesobacillus maritimus TaxID=1643336 RepID=UPI00203FFF18|nr:DUF2777 domain-containing protein [Mesobacillus maritimus]MCM3586105.1 DUF2777 domain-containing protein [Mesobacillus maritimus]MCM3667432.1 DUF2777 domain-containing protein [Mesobacillus maritimus]
MNQQQRLILIEKQDRSFETGTIEYINQQWVFFDEETEEASLLDHFLHQEIEISRTDCWLKGMLIEGGRVQCGSELFDLHDRETIRIRKQLIYSLERLLEQLQDEAFLYFINTLNSLQFSVHDCIYCYNHLNFLNPKDRVNGVNFLIFDNEEEICSIQHHFDYSSTRNDRFEFTLNNGKRTVIEKIS